MRAFDVIPPPLGSVAAKKIFFIRAKEIAVAHIAHGSRETYMSQSSKNFVPSFLHARFIATISACRVGFLRNCTWFSPRAIIFPSRTITAPIGTSSWEKARRAQVMA